MHRNNSHKRHAFVTAQTCWRLRVALALVIGVAIVVGDVVFVVLEAITLEVITWIQR